MYMEEFLKAADFNYDNGYGLNEVNTDLVIYGDGWLLQRWEYDGAEGWDFLPIDPDKYKYGEIALKTDDWEGTPESFQGHQ